MHNGKENTLFEIRDPNSRGIEMEKQESPGPDYYWVDGHWRKRPIKKKGMNMKKRSYVRFFVLVGLTTITLIFLSIFIVIGEQYNLIQFQVGPGLYGLSPLDTWLIIILCVFGPGIFLAFYFTFKFKIINVD